jgi:hypothetical protein
MVADLFSLEYKTLYFANGSAIFVYNKDKQIVGRYRGSLIDSFPEGFGILKIYKNFIYAGDFKSGSMNGKGKWKSELGSRYTGEWKNGKKHGYGIYEFGTGDVYEGEYKNDKFHGKGKLLNDDGSSYDGE